MVAKASWPYGCQESCTSDMVAKASWPYGCQESCTSDTELVCTGTSFSNYMKKGWGSLKKVLEESRQFSPKGRSASNRCIEADF